MPNAERQPTSAEIERGVPYMAYVVDTYGERYAPILDSLIADLDVASIGNAKLDDAIVISQLR